MTATDPYSRKSLVASLDRLVGEAADLTAQWLARDREDWKGEKAIAGRLLNVHRAMSATMHAIGQIDYEEWARGWRSGRR